MGIKAAGGHTYKRLKSKGVSIKQVKGHRWSVQKAGGYLYIYIYKHSYSSRKEALDLSF